jgi:hypothetical protein
MSHIDLAERLSRMVDAADEKGAYEQNAVARRHTANGMLQSGNFFIAEKQALQSIYGGTMQLLATHALSVTAPGSAARAVRIAGQDLESKFMARFEGILGGSASGQPCPPTASKKMLSEFRTTLSERLDQAVSDTENNVIGKPLQGWQGWVIRHGWNSINTAIAVSALYWSWVKK